MTGKTGAGRAAGSHRRAEMDKDILMGVIAMIVIAAIVVLIFVFARNQIIHAFEEMKNRLSFTIKF